MADPIIKINNFQLGMSSSPHVSDGAVLNSVNLDPFTNLGITKLNRKTALYNSCYPAFTPNWIVAGAYNGYTVALLANGSVNGYPDINILDGTGIVMATLTHSGNDGAGHAPSSGVGNGMIIWKGYLVVVGNTTIDFQKVSTGTWYNRDVLTLTNNIKWHTCFVSRNDGCLYIADDNILHKIAEVVGKTFDPTDASTFAVDTVMLTLPSGYHIRCIEERGIYILCGTYKGTNIYDVQDATIFPWDRTSSSYNMPYYFPECGVMAMKNIAGTVYAIIGTQIKLYSISESGYQYLGKLFQDSQTDYFFEVYPSAIGVLKGNLCFGVSAGTTAITIPIYGLYTWNGKFNIEHLLSTGNTGYAIITSILSTGNNAMLICYKDYVSGAWVYNIDNIGQNKYDAYTGYVESLLYRIGSRYAFVNIGKTEVQFAKPLASGDGIQIKYRRDVSSAYTTLATITFETNGAITSWSCDNLIPKVENIQFRIELKGNTELLELRAIPIL